MQKRTLMLARGISPAAFCSCAGACSLPIPLGCLPDGDVVGVGLGLGGWFPQTARMPAGSVFRGAKHYSREALSSK